MDQVGKEETFAQQESARVPKLRQTDHQPSTPTLVLDTLLFFFMVAEVAKAVNQAKAKKDTTRQRRRKKTKKQREQEQAEWRKVSLIIWETYHFWL